MRVEVNDDQNEGRTVFRTLAVTDKLIVADRMKLDGPIVLQRGIFQADPIYKRNKLMQTVGPVQIPLTNLIFLGIEIFLTALLQRAVVQQLESGPVNAIIRAQRRRQKEADHERRTQP